MKINSLFVKIGAVVFVISLSAKLQAIEVPKDFEKQTSFGADFWMQPKTLETISLTNEDVSQLAPGKNDLAELAEIMKAKGETLSVVLNIKDYKVLSSEEQKTKNGKLILFFGSYLDSSSKLTNFAELYDLPAVGKPQAYLLTRYNTAWSKKEIMDRFRVNP